MTNLRNQLVQAAAIAAIQGHDSTVLPGIIDLLEQKDETGSRILKHNEPPLRTICDNVPEGKHLHEMFDIMRSLMKNNVPEGVGLAANQIGVTWRAILLVSQGIDAEIINPVITKRSKQKFPSKEECLSCPGLHFTVWRHKQVTVTGFTVDWKPLKLKLRGFNAACVQHEIDHLDGITLLTRQQEKEKNG